MPNKRPALPIDLEAAFACQARPLGPADLAFLQNEVTDFAPAWSVELQGICQDEACLVVLPEDAEDENGPSFVISRESYGLRLDHVHWDEMTEVGVFVSLHKVLAALRAWLSFASRPPSVTLH